MQPIIKSLQRADSASQNCSCTSCDYGIGPYRFSLRRIKNGSNVDKLAQYKNISVREQKLIEKLIKTRAVYDDLRKQLLSESNINTNEANLKLRKRVKSREFDNIEKSAVLHVVDLVDKGMSLESNEWNNCCRCCRCSSKVHVHDNIHKNHNYNRRGRVRSGPHVTSTSSVTSKQRQRKDPKSRQSASFKIKRIQSEPCRCTLKFSGLLDRQSNLLFTQNSTEKSRVLPEHTTEVPQKHNLHREKHKKSLQIIKHSKAAIKDHLEPGIKKSVEIITDFLERRMPLHPKIDSELPTIIPETTSIVAEKPFPHYNKNKNSKKYPSICKCARKDIEDKFKKSLQKLSYSKRIMKGHLQSGAEKSVEKLKFAKHKVTDRIQSMQSDYVKYSILRPFLIEKLDEYRFISAKKGSNRDKMPVTIKEKIEYSIIPGNRGGTGKKETKVQEELKEQRMFKLNKDSITKFKEKLKRKEHLHDYECEPECYPEKCVPENCFEKLKLKKARRKKRSSQMPVKMTEQEHYTTGYNNSDINMKDKENTDKNEILLARKLEPYPTVPVRTKNRNRSTRTFNQIPKSSETSINMTTSGHTLKRCFCTLKLKPNFARRKGDNKGILTSNFIYLNQMPLKPLKINTSKTIDKLKYGGKPDIFPFECKSGVCVPNKCDPKECLKLINKIEGRHIKRLVKYTNPEYQKTRSTSSFTSRSIPHPTKKVQSSTTAYESKVQYKKQDMRKKPISIKRLPSGKNRHMVRISSSFSFNIEFVKKNPLHAFSAPIIEQKSNMWKDRASRPKMKQGGFQSDIRRQKKSFTHMENKEVGTTGFSSKRCFCTLNVLKNKILRTTMNHTTTSTETFFLEKRSNVKRSIATKTKKLKLRHKKRFETLECEPNVCIPGECVPYKCFERIKKRNKKLIKEFGTTTHPSKMKSIPSMTQNLEKSKGTLTQSKLIQHHIYTEEFNKKPKGVIPLSISSIEQNSRQTVTIGSTFSFNIEFSKSRLKSSKSNHNKLRENIIEPIGKVRSHRTEPEEFPVSYQKQQIISKMKVDKSASMIPKSKRCFCTLKLQNRNKKSRILTVSRLTVAEKKRKHPQYIYGKEENLYREMQLPKCDFKFKDMNEYFHKNTLRPLQSWISKERCLKIENDSKLEVNRNILNYFTYSEACFTKSKKAINSFSISKPYFAKRNTTYSVHKKQYNHSESLNLNISRSEVTGVNPLLKRCYCTMNIQIPNITRYDKLKPYECEPGVCTPDECDPYECQKRIMKRLMRKTSTMSGTDTKSILNQGSQSTTSSKARKLQSAGNTHAKNKTTKPAGIKYSLPSKANKKVVRIGSSFSFNIEFSKVKSQSQRDYRRFKENKPAMRTKPVKTESRKPNEQGTSRFVDSIARDSQTINITSKSVPSSTSALLQRCFCTLKFQKAGKLNNSNKLQKNTQKTMTKRNRNYEIAKPSSASISQNTKAVRIHNVSHDLLPFECEPNTCVPGECDSYECLQRIKLRNIKHRNVSSGSNVSRTKSTSSVTTKYSTHSRGKQITSRFKNKIEGTQKIPSKESKPIKLSSIRQPSRQSIRVGSNFSFNIEFYKSTSDSSQPIPFETQSHDKKSFQVHEKESKKKAMHSKHKRKARSTQDKQGNNHKYSQHGRVANVKSTMTTSLTKRCFCTKKMHAIDKRYPKNISSSKSINNIEKNPEVKRSRNLIKKCLCVLKLLAISKNKKTPPSRTKSGKVTQIDKGQVTDRVLEWKTHKVEFKECEPGICAPYKCDSYVCNERIKQRKWKLEPYECEPGICVPGNCDPYICDKIIKQRKWGQNLKSTNTSKPRTKSSSSSYKSNISRATRMQTNLKPQQKTQVKTKTVSRPSEQVKMQQKSIIFTPSTRQIVSIGSNISFNIEFYKERSPNADEIQVAAKMIAPPKKIKQSVSQKSGRSPKTKSVATYNKGDTLFNRQSQAAIQTADRSTGSALKRCFCTLQLQNQHANGTLVQQRPIAPVKNVPITFDKGIMVAEKYKKIIEPYECEPNVCIPGECDPQECLKLIKKRNLKFREASTITKRHNAKSISSMAYTTSNNTNTQITRKLHKNAQVKTKTTKLDDKSRKSVISTITKPSKQAVKLGSSFSFNIEFLKDKSYNNVETKIAQLKKRKPIDNNNRSTNISSNNRNNLSQSDKFLHHRDSQVLAGKKHDKMTGAHPLLKKCFCTLKLQKSNDMESQPILDTAPNKNKFGSLSKHMRNKVIYFAALQPYECEPGICVPYECDPTICEKRIRQRTADSKETNTDKIKLPSSSRKASISSQSKSHEQNVRKLNLRKTYKSGEKQYNKPLGSTDHHVRFGSNFTIGIDFYKNSSLAETSRTPRTRDILLKYKSNKSKDYKTKTKNKDKGIDSPRKQRVSNATVAVPKTASQYSSAKPLKRCFCTLKLQQTGKKGQEIKNKPSSSEQGTNAILKNNDKNRFLKIRNQLRNLEPYECEPNVCVPEQCDPHICIERIKRRVRDSSTGTRKISKNLNDMSDNVSYKSTGTQLDLEKKKKNLRKQKGLKDVYPKNIKVTELSPGDWPNPQRYMFIQDEKFTRKGKSNEGSQKVYRIGSKLSIDLEFYKIQSQKETPKLKKKYSYKMDQGAQIYSNSKDKETGISFLKKCFCTAPPHVRDKLEKRLTNVTKSDTQDKSPSFIKRCLCTLKLHSAKKRQNVLTVHRLAVEEERKGFYNPSALHKTVKEKNRINNNWHDFNNDFSKKLSIIPRNNVFCYCVNCDYNEMKTIYPYVPRKFNKHISKTIVTYENESPKTYWNGGKHRQIQYSRCFDSTKQPIIKPSDPIKRRIKLTPKHSSTEITLLGKRFNFKLLYKFLRKLKCNKFDNENKTVEDVLTAPFIKKQRKFRTVRPMKAQNEILKSCYSDRCPIHQNVTCDPKKSKSLKISKPDENAFAEAIKKKYSRFQSGDFDQSDRVRILHNSRHIHQDSIDNYNRNKCSVTYSQTDCNKKHISTKIPIKSAYADNKLVQFSLITPGKNKNCRGKCNECTSMEKHNASINIMKQSTLDKNPNMICDSRCKNLKKLPHSEIKRKSVISIDSDKKKLTNFKNYTQISFFKTKRTKKSKTIKDEDCVKDPCYVQNKKCTAKNHTLSKKSRLKITNKVNFLKLINNATGVPSRPVDNSKEPRLVYKQKGKAVNLVNNLKGKQRLKSYGKGKDPRLVNIQNRKLNISTPNPKFDYEELRMKTCICSLNKTHTQASNDITGRPQAKCSPCCRQICSHGVHLDPFTIMKHKKPKKPLVRSDLCRCLSCECYMCSKKNKTSELLASDWPNPQRYIFIDKYEEAGTISEPKDKNIKNDIGSGKKTNKMNGKLSGMSRIKQRICSIFANFTAKILSSKSIDNSSKACHICSVFTDGKNDDMSAGPRHKGKLNTPDRINEKRKDGTNGRTDGKKQGETKGKKQGETKGKKQVETKGKKQGETEGMMQGESKGKKQGETKVRKIGEDIATAMIKKVGIAKTCTCGSKICKKNFDQKSVTGLFWSGPKLKKPCKCGIVICKRESKKQENRAMTKEHKELLALQKKNLKLQLGRAVKYKIEDEERRTKRRKKDVMLKRKLRKELKTSSNWGLVGESLVDIAKLGCRTKKSILRCATRTITDPKNVFTAMKTSVLDPKKIVGNVDNAFSTIGVGPTLKRVGTRLCATTPAMSIMDTLDDKFNLQAIGGKKRKKKKRKAKRRQPPVDFACSLFMASLRKKPCLAVYYACPWFYPHCLSFLTIWKQFTDVMLFLLAVTVWSPCILAMEICRAFVCCTFCTG